MISLTFSLRPARSLKRAAATQALDLYQSKGNRPGARDSLRYLADHIPAGKDSPMADSQVTSVELTKEGSTALTIQVVGFKEGKYVEISGYVTQDNGAYASFRDSREVPKADSEGGAQLTVFVPSEKFKLKLAKKRPVTVVTWVSEVWPSMLIEATPTEEFKAAWKIKPNGTDPSSY